MPGGLWSADEDHVGPCSATRSCGCAPRSGARPAAPGRRHRAAVWAPQRTRLADGRRRRSPGIRWSGTRSFSTAGCGRDLAEQSACRRRCCGSGLATARVLSRTGFESLSHPDRSRHICWPLPGTWRRPRRKRPGHSPAGSSRSVDRIRSTRAWKASIAECGCRALPEGARPPSPSPRSGGRPDPDETSMAGDSSPPRRPG
jgi:hypothetical protein